jgi:hypothetical protein
MRETSFPEASWLLREADSLSWPLCRGTETPVSRRSHTAIWNVADPKSHPSNRPVVTYAAGGLPIEADIHPDQHYGVYRD